MLVKVGYFLWKRIFKNKKASEQLIETVITDIILISIILITILSGVVKISDNSVHIERAKVRDFALLYDAVNIRNENFNIVYNLPASTTQYTITPNAPPLNLLLTLYPSCKIEIKEQTKQRGRKRGQ